MSSVPVWIDTDTGVDDAIALMAAIALQRQKKLEIVGISAVCGNAEQDRTFENARKVIGAVEAMPLERLVFETDAPYLPPHPYKRKNRCDSRMIAITAERAAQIRGTDGQTLIDAARENAMQLFGIA